MIRPRRRKTLAMRLAGAAVFTAFCLAASTGPTLAENPDSTWRLELLPGFSWLRTETKDIGGESLGGFAGYRFWNQCHVGVTAAYTLFSLPDYSRAHYVQTTAGLSYEIDRLPIVPEFTAGIGPYYKSKSHAHGWKTDLGTYAGFNLHYFIDNAWALGGAIRYNYLPKDFTKTPIYFDFSFQIVYEF